MENMMNAKNKILNVWNDFVFIQSTKCEHMAYRAKTKRRTINFLRLLCNNFFLGFSGNS
jgi:hypothetical protein